MKIKSELCNVFVKKASLYLEKMIYNNNKSTSALCLYVCGLIVGTPLQRGCKNSQGGGKNFQLALLVICHPPDQNAETAPAAQSIISNYLYICLQGFNYAATMFVHQ